MNHPNPSEKWSSLAKIYDPIKVGSIDATDDVAHDKALIRALKSDYKPNDEVKGDPRCTLFVGRLNPTTNEETIEKFFSQFGPIVRLRLVRELITGLSRRYAFVEFKKERHAIRAYESGHKCVIDDREILVDWEWERKMIGWKPRRLGGGFGGKKESGQLRFGCRERPWRKPIGIKGDTIGETATRETFRSHSKVFETSRKRSDEDYKHSWESSLVASTSSSNTRQRNESRSSRQKHHVSNPLSREGPSSFPLKSFSARSKDYGKNDEAYDRH